MIYQPKSYARLKGTIFPPTIYVPTYVIFLLRIIQKDARRWFISDIKAHLGKCEIFVEIRIQLDVSADQYLWNEER